LHPCAWGGLPRGKVSLEGAAAFWDEEEIRKEMITIREFSHEKLVNLIQLSMQHSELLTSSIGQPFIRFVPAAVDMQADELQGKPSYKTTARHSTNVTCSLL
jgi:hypothetical protein